MVGGAVGGAVEPCSRTMQRDSGKRGGNSASSLGPLTKAREEKERKIGLQSHCLVVIYKAIRGER